MVGSDDFGAVWLSVQLASVTVVALFVLGTPIAWWLAFTTSRFRPVVEAVTTMPLILPPTVLGFYLLILFGPAQFPGSWWVSLTGDTLSFSFVGLVIASIIYSFPFVVQPLTHSFGAMGRGPMEDAACLGAGPIDRFFTVAVPMARRGFITAGVLSFAHTLGEFGVVLMVGGNIPGKTRVISIAIYENVETLNYASAHALSAGLLVFSFVVLMVVFLLNRQFPVGAPNR